MRHLLGGKVLVLATSLILACALLGSTAHAACTGGSPTWTTTIDQNSVNSCLSSSSAGDTINVSSGSATWSSVSLTGRTLACPSQSCTISGNVAVAMTQSTSAYTNLSGFTFTNCGSDASPDVSLSGDGTMMAGRIYNNTFNNTSGSCIFIDTYTHNTTTAYPVQLIDHNTLISGNAAEMIHVDAYSAGNGLPDGWTNDVTPGAANMTFIENNLAECPSSACSGGAANNLSESYNGSRTVIRYNHLQFAQVDQHGTASTYAVRWFEIYNNTFNDEGMEQSSWIVIRDGSGAVFNNSVTWSGGYGPPDIGMQDEDCGSYPDPGQVGRGINSGGYQLSPVYYWNNTPSTSAPVHVEQCPGNIQINRDYFTSTTQPSVLNRCQSAADLTAGCPVSYAYKPYTYPHPLDNCSASNFGAGATCGSTSTSTPSPPSSLSGALK